MVVYEPARRIITPESVPQDRIEGYGVIKAAAIDNHNGDLAWAATVGIAELYRRMDRWDLSAAVWGVFDPAEHPDVPIHVEGVTVEPGDLVAIDMNVLPEGIDWTRNPFSFYHMLAATTFNGFDAVALMNEIWTSDRGTTTLPSQDPFRVEGRMILTATPGGQMAGTTNQRGHHGPFELIPLGGPAVRFLHTAVAGPPTPHLATGALLETKIWLLPATETGMRTPGWTDEERVEFAVSELTRAGSELLPPARHLVELISSLHDTVDINITDDLLTWAGGRAALACLPDALDRNVRREVFVRAITARSELTDPTWDETTDLIGACRALAEAARPDPRSDLDAWLDQTAEALFEIEDEVVAGKRPPDDLVKVANEAHKDFMLCWLRPDHWLGRQTIAGFFGQDQWRRIQVQEALMGAAGKDTYRQQKRLMRAYDRWQVALDEATAGKRPLPPMAGLAVDAWERIDG